MSGAVQSLPERVGRYQIVRLLGEGAMGRVLLGHDPVLDRAVAVKVLRSDLKLPEDQRLDLIQRMRHEARASARAAHPNIVVLYDMGEEPGLGLFLVNEYLEGITLKERILRGRIGAHEGAELAQELGAALTTAHVSGVLHRDVKPDNILITDTGSKITDFGIARIPNSTLTRNGGLLGTPAYSSPESITNGEFTAYSDQFSLAATLYEALSGRRAFPGDDAATVARRIEHEEPAPIAAAAALDPHVDAVLLRAMDKDPSARFESCRAFGAALAEALTLERRAILATLPDSAHRRKYAVAARRRAVALVCLGAVAGVVGTALVFRIGEEVERTSPAREGAERPSDDARPVNRRRSEAPARPPGDLDAGPGRRDRP
jgi:serine/threonine-protein kinase